MIPLRSVYFCFSKDIVILSLHFFIVVYTLLFAGCINESTEQFNPLPIKDEYKKPFKDKIKNLETKANLKIQFFSIDGVPPQKLHSSINRAVNKVSNSSDYLFFFFREEPSLISIRTSSVVLMQRKFVSELLEEIKKQTLKNLKNQRKILTDKMLLISLNAIELSLKQYEFKTGWTRKYLTFVGSIYSTLNSVSLNDFVFYQKYILKPFFNIFVAILAVFNFSFWLFIILIITVYHIKDILTFFPLLLIKKISKHFTTKKKPSPKTLWITQYIIFLIDKALKYLIPMPLLATISLLTSGMPENADFVSFILIDYFDIPHILKLLPLKSSTGIGNLALNTDSGIVIGGLIALLGYLYFWFGFQILAIRWKVATCLKDEQWIKKVISRVGNPTAAMSLIEYWRYMSWQNPIFGGGKLIVEDGLTVNLYMASKNWRPIVRGLAATVLPLSLGIYFLWDSILKTLKALKVFWLYRKQLEPIRELIP